MKQLLALAIVALALGVAWRWTPLSDLVDPGQVIARAQAWRGEPIVLLLGPPLFVLLSCVFVPLGVLRLTTVVVLGPVLGSIYAIVGVALCALLGHAIGTRVGSDGLERIAPRRVAQLRGFLERRGGIFRIAAMRLVPLGPFMLVNTAAGAARLRRRDFVAGTVLGLTPGLVFILVFVTSAGV